MDAQSSSLNSFGNDLNIAVIGGSGGIGGNFVQQLSNSPTVKKVLVFSRKPLAKSNFKQRSFFIDLEDERSIEKASEFARDAVGHLNLAIVTTGLLHKPPDIQPERSWKEISPEALASSFRINAAGPLLVAKHFLPLLYKGGKSVFATLSARVGSIEDNRLGGWYAYRVSKAALNMAIKNLSIELSRKNKNGICVGLHPGTVDTKLSKPFQRSVPTGQLKSPSQCVRDLLGVLDNLKYQDSGLLFGWDGKKIPY